MNNIFIRLTVRFIFFLLFQVLVLNNIEPNGLMNPYFYPLFILLLPLQVPQWLCLLLSFALGASVGIFTNSSGLHAMASVMMAFVRPFVIQIIFPQSDNEGIEEIAIAKAGVFNFVLYATVLVFVHHFVFFVVEIWSFTKFYFTISKILLSTAISVLLMILNEYLFWRKTSSY